MTRMNQAQRRWPAPFAPRALPRFPATTEQSAPSQRIGTFGLAVGAACAFSLGIAGQVLTFRTRVRLKLRAAYMPDAAWACEPIRWLLPYRIRMQDTGTLAAQSP
jgi:hypothetical protein